MVEALKTGSPDLAFCASPSDLSTPKPIMEVRAQTLSIRTFQRLAAGLR